PEGSEMSEKPKTPKTPEPLEEPEEPEKLKESEEPEELPEEGPNEGPEEGSKEGPEEGLKEAINFISDAWDDVSDTTIKNCWKATKIVPDTSELNKYREKEDRQKSRPENELEDVIFKVDDVDMLVEDFSIENNLGVRELISNIEEYTHLIDQLVITEDVLTDEEIIEIVNYEFRDDNDETDNNDDDKPSPPPPIIMLRP
ncbi:17160_t:CDS:2, partial [Gigaspora rosea]